MVVINDTTVRAYRNVYAGFFEVFVTSLANVNQSSCLATADTFLFTGNADRTTADTNFNEVSASLSQEAEAFSVYYVACANLNAVTVVLTDPIQGDFLPCAVAFGGVNAEYVYACINQCGNTLSIVAGVDTCANDVAFFAVQQLQRIFLMSCIVFTEYHVQHTAVVINDRQSVEFFLPDDIVSLLQGGIFRSINHFVNRSHEVTNLSIHRHTARTIVTAGNNAFQLAVSGTIAGNSNSGVTGAFLQCQDVSQSAVRTDIGVAAYKACAIAFNTSNHSSFVLYGLRTIDERNAALFGKSYSQLFAGNSLHDSRNHRDVHSNCRLLAFFEFNQRRTQVYIGGDTFFGGITGN